MSWKNTTAPTRRLLPSIEEWIPSTGQAAAVEFLISHATGALWADPGAGKTSITLTAFTRLHRAGQARKMLVMAPLRVCQLVWRQEVEKWAHTRHLRVALLHGPKKDAALQEDADIYLINYEGLAWLSKKLRGRPWPFDVICADELTKMKNYRSERFKAIKPFLSRARRRWGLTGTPAPNGYLDLFGQFMFLDEGATLGRYFSHYRDTYFEPGYDGFTFELRKGAEDDIQKRIENSVYRLSYTDLPPLIDDPRYIEMDKKSAKVYKQMKDAMLVEVDGKLVTAANAAATFAKLRQMANGAVYTSEEADVPKVIGRGAKREYVVIHDAKLDALEELLEELQGSPLLVAYSFQHDLDRIRKRLGGDVPVLGSGTTEKRAVELQDAWNRGELPILLCHPDSVGHGLNLQQGNAAHMCWFSADFNLELYDQFKRRIWRKGNKSEHVFNHRLIVKGTIDELVYAALEDKDVTQARLLQSVSEVLGAPTSAGEDVPETAEGATMPIERRLPTQGGASSAPAPRGWGARTSTQAEEVEDEQVNTTASKLRGPRQAAQPEPEEEAFEQAPPPRSRFSPGLQSRMAGQAADPVDEAEDEGPAAPPPAQRRVTQAASDGAPVARTTTDTTLAARDTEQHGPCTVSVHFHGTPAQVRQAMRDLLG